MNRDIMRKAGLGHIVDRVEQGLCPFCDAKVDPNTFRDELSRREFHISGLCQHCQDKVFGEYQSQMLELCGEEDTTFGNPS